VAECLERLKETDKYLNQRSHMYGASKAQLAACQKAPFKTMTFDGKMATVQMANFLGMPQKVMTVAFWLKGAKGTMFSYASKRNVRAFVVENPDSIRLHIMNQVIETNVAAGNVAWTHLAVSWSSSTGKVVMYVNGKAAFTKSGVKKGMKITPGGCLMLGQKALQACKKRLTKAAYSGQLADFMIWASELGAGSVKGLMTAPVPSKVINQIDMRTGTKASKLIRVAYLSRQWSQKEQQSLQAMHKKHQQMMKKKAAKLAALKALKTGGRMTWRGSGDVHYNNFANCKYDDQSCGEWVAVKVAKEFRPHYPLEVQYRTSPQKTRCSWCQDGAVAYIDGCAVSYKSDQASAGFGGYNTGGYKPYAAFNGKPFQNKKWVKGPHIKAMAYTSNRRAYGYNHGHFKAYLSDGSRVMCAKGQISVTIPRGLTGKIAGIAGNGIRGKWPIGPKGTGQMPGFGAHNGCPAAYQYHIKNSPYNGNHATKPIVKFFHTWQVDGKKLESIFYYSHGHGPGSFNRKAGQAVKPVKGGMSKRPQGARAKAMHKCRALRNNIKARDKCVFDVLVMGKKAAKESVRDRQAKRIFKPKIVPTSASVRDTSKWDNTAKWVGKPTWGCSSGFASASGQKYIAEEE